MHLHRKFIWVLVHVFLTVGRQRLDHHDGVDRKKALRVKCDGGVALQADMIGLP